MTGYYGGGKIKLIISHDVTHTLTALEKGIYGNIVMILQKNTEKAL
jgi:hypothetical protein